MDQCSVQIDNEQPINSSTQRTCHLICCSGTTDPDGDAVRDGRLASSSAFKKAVAHGDRAATMLGAT